MEEVQGDKMKEVQRQGMVQEQCIALGMAIDNLYDIVGVLCERLESVLREETRVDNTKSEEQHIPCPLAARIHAYRGRVHSITDVLEDLVNRLEV